MIHAPPRRSKAYLVGLFVAGGALCTFALVGACARDPRAVTAPPTPAAVPIAGLGDLVVSDAGIADLDALLSALGPPATLTLSDAGAWVMYLDGGCRYVAPEDWSRSAQESDVSSRRDADEYREGCARREPASCAMLAWSYQEGRGVAPDPAAAAALRARAILLYRPQCERGEGEACDALASAYRLGEGVAEDAAAGDALGKRAFALLEKACAKGDGEACRREAHKRFMGEDIPKDRERASAVYARAVTLLEAACASGDPEACRGVFAIFANGDGAPRDEERANRAIARAHLLWEAACARGDVAACATVKKLSPR